MVILNFLHLAGIIIMVGSVTVIDVFGFVGRRSKKWTKNTIEAHYITKPLIWIGATIVSITWIALLFLIDIDFYAKLKSFIIPLLLLNGAFLSFYISPRLSRQRGEEKLLPSSMQISIAISFIISITLNWSFVFLTVLMYSE